MPPFTSVTKCAPDASSIAGFRLVVGLNCFCQSKEALSVSNGKGKKGSLWCDEMAEDLFLIHISLFRGLSISRCMVKVAFRKWRSLFKVFKYLFETAEIV